jgi:ATP-dependent Clp protease ATP-binding subunit ClpC
MFTEDEGHNIFEKNTKGKLQALTAFGRDLTALAATGKIDPVIGREDEIERIAQILGRRKKNNPLLLGDPGVGKSAIVNGLALRIVQGKVPVTLVNKKIYSLELSTIVAGTKYRGQFEERMKAILDELRENPTIIVFIDEIHQIVGAGGSSGSMDASNIFKPALASGEIQCIGATTYDEYRENIEGEGALDRRFQKVNIDEPSLEETFEIIKQIKELYENHHGVIYTDEIIELAIQLSDRYINDRMLPDKALDIIDEVGSRIHMKMSKMPDSIKKLEEKAKLYEDKKKESVSMQDYEKAAGYRDLLNKAKEQIESEKSKWKKQIQKNKQPVTKDDVLDVTSLMTGIPVSEVGEEEMERLAKMSTSIKKDVVGQDEAIDKIVSSIQRSRIGLARKNRPIGNFLLVGSTGTGKTWLAKSVAKHLFGSEDAMVRFDMGEFMEKHSVSRLMGAPPGYVGYEEGGQLTELIKRQPYSLILFDEIEKAHRDVFNALLQVMDDGFMTDSLGRKVSFKNCIIMMTSNIGARKSQDFGAGIGFGKSAQSGVDKNILSVHIQEELKKTFSPEFINRIDDVIHFNPIDPNGAQRIVKLQVKDLEERVEEMGYFIHFTKGAIEELAKVGFDQKYGARTLSRAIQQLVEVPISTLVINNKIPKGSSFRVIKSRIDGSIKVEVQ